MQNHLKTLQSLEKKIAVSRRKLQELWNTRGFTDMEVLVASVELDILLNLYQKQKSRGESDSHMK